MAELDARDVIWDRGLTRRDLLDLVRRCVQKRRLLVDEPTDQPRTCDPIDAGLLARDPLHRYAPFGLLFRGPAETGNVADCFPSGLLKVTATVQSPARARVMVPI